MSKKSKASSQPAYESLFFSRTSDFLSIYLERQAGRSHYTKKAYKAGLSSFYDYVVDIRRLSPMQFQYSQCSYQFVLEYSSDCDASVISVYIAVCRVPFLVIPKVQMPIIQNNDLAGFLDSPDHTRIGNRDRFILILMFDSAIRVSELVRITLGDIIEDNGSYSVLIHGKGRKERCIILSERTGKHMEVYLKTYHNDHQTKASRPLFYTVTHGVVSNMSVRNVERILNKYGAKARQDIPSIPASVSPHTIRRSRATSLYRDGVPLEQVSALLGHSQIETTRTHYASPSPEQMKAAVEKGSDKVPEQKPEWLGHTDDLKRKFGLV